MKKTPLYTAIALFLAVVLTACNKPNDHVKQINIENETALIAALNSAITAINNPNITTVEIDMTTLKKLTLGGDGWADLEKAINQLTEAAQKYDKTLVILLPEINIAGAVRLPFVFYSATKAGNAHALISMDSDGQLHFVGAVPTSATIRANVGAQTVPPRKTGNNASFYPITADRIDINNDGMTDNCWSVFNVVKSDTISATSGGASSNPGSPALFHRGLGRNVIGKTRSDKKVPFINAQNVQLEQNSHIEMRQIEFPDDAEHAHSTVRFTTIPRMRNWVTDTIDEGYSYQGGRKTLHPKSWAHRIGESHFKYAPGLTARLSITDKNGGQNFIINVPKYIPGENDNAFHNIDGRMHALVCVQSLAEFLAGRVFPGGVGYQNTMRFTEPVAIKVPAQITEHGLTETPPHQVWPYLTSTAVCWQEFLEWAGVKRETNQIRILPTIGMTVKTR